MWLLGCTGNVAVKGGAVDEALPITATTPEGTDPQGDALLVTELVEGQRAVDAVLTEVAWSGGWPVRDGEAVWFVLRDGGPGPWSVAGDFSAWEPIEMTRGEGFFWARVEGAASAGGKYKFVSGQTWMADPLARSYDYDAYGEISYVAPDESRPRLDRWPGVTGSGASEGLSERELAVYVPAGAGPWPVLYAQDGQNLFDPGAIWGGWQMQAALAGREGILVVGIANTPYRMDEYTHVPDDIGYGYLIGGQAEAYAALVEDQIRPHIEATYGTTGKDGVLGSSLGGLVSLYIAERYPGRYDFAASLSGTLGWGRFAEDNDTIEELWLAAPPPETAVYVDSGGDPGGAGCVDPDGDGFPEDDPDASDNYCETRHFADALAASGYTWDVDLFHWWEPDAPHNEAAWASRVGMPLDLFLALP